MISITFPPGTTSLQIADIRQYDSGQVLEISGTGITTETVEGHFDVAGRGHTYDIEATVADGKITLEIPQYVTAFGRTIRCYLYVITENYRITKFEVVVPVKPRAKPADYISPAEPPYMSASELKAQLDGLDSRVDGAEAEIGQRYTKTEVDGFLAGKLTKVPVSKITPTLLNSFTSYGETWTVRFWIDAESYVRAEGFLKVGDVTAAGTEIFRFPAGFRPLQASRWELPGFGSTSSRVSISPDGRVRLERAAISGDSYHVSPINFLAEQ